MVFTGSLIPEKQAPLCELCVSNGVGVRKEYLTPQYDLPELRGRHDKQDHISSKLNCNSSPRSRRGRKDNEYYLSEKTTEKVLLWAEEAVEKGAEVEILRYAA